MCASIKHTLIGGRQDFPGFSDAGHYPMQETPVYFASLVENFVSTHSR